MLQCRQLFQIIRLYIGAVDNPLLFPTCSVSHHNPDTREALADKTASVTFRNAEEVALPPLLPLAFFLPPSPRPPSPPGKGEIFSFLMQGASPLASPGAERSAALARRELAAPRGALAVLVADSPCRYEFPAGGLPSLSPAYPAFSLLSRPHPPDPLPLRGRGTDY